MTTAVIARPDLGRHLQWLRSPQGLRRTLLATASVMVGGAVYSTSGAVALMSAATSLALVWLMIRLWKYDSNIVSSMVATAAATAAVLAFAVSTTLSEYSAGGGGYYLAYITAVPAISIAVWATRRTGFHRGRTTVLAQLALLVTMPAHRWFGGATTGVIAGVILAIAVIWLSSRHAAAPTPLDTRWKRHARTGARGICAGLIIALLSTTVLLGSAPKAQAFDPFGVFGDIKDGVSSTAHDAICAVTSPNLTPESPGAGPESWFSNRNLANAPGASQEVFDPKKPLSPTPVPGPVPEYAKDVNIVSTQTEIKDGKYTLFDLNGLRGLSWVNWQYGQGKSEGTPDNCGISDWMWTMVGNGIMTVNLYLLQGVIALKELAQSQNPLAWLYDYSNSAVAQMFAHFTIPAAVIAIMLGAVGLAIAGLRNGSGYRDKLAKFVTGLVFIVVGGFLFNGIGQQGDGGASYENPSGSGFYTIASTLDDTIGKMNGAITTGVLSQLQDYGGRDALCSPINGPDAEVNGQRLSSCVLAETLAYQPFLQGQFGSASRKRMEVPDDRITAEPTTTEQPAESSQAPGMAGEVSRGSAALEKYAEAAGKIPCYVAYDGCHDLRTYYLVHQGGPAYYDRQAACLNIRDTKMWTVTIKATTQCVPIYAVAGQLGAPETYYGTGTFAAFGGMQGMQRVTQAGAALFGTGIVGIAILVLAVAILLAHASLFGLFFASPVVFAVGVFMGKVHVIKSWGKHCLATFSQRFLYSFAMTMVIFIVCLIFRSDRLNVGLRLLFVGLMLFFFLKLFNKVEDMVSPNNGQVNHNYGDKTIQGLDKMGNKGKDVGRQGRDVGRRVRNDVGDRYRSARKRNVNDGGVPGAGNAAPKRRTVKPSGAMPKNTTPGTKPGCTDGAVIAA